MNLEPSSEQMDLVATVKAVCERHFGMEVLHQLSEVDHKKNAANGMEKYESGWSALEDLGLFQLVQKEEAGGVGLGFQEAALVFEELGRNIVPGPVLGTFLASWLQTVEGKLERTEVVESSGPTLVIPNPHLISNILLLKTSEALLVDCSSLKIKMVEHPLDPLTPVGTADLTEALDAPSSVLAGADTGKVGAVLISAFQTGLAEGAMNLAVEYAGERKQFGSVIGSFQAVKHLCADMLTLVEVARAAVYAAAAGLDDSDPPDYMKNTYLESCSSARIMAAKAAGFCGQSCVQVFGGMGYTWEADPHLYLKRAWVTENIFGSVSSHAKLLSDLMLK